MDDIGTLAVHLNKPFVFISFFNYKRVACVSLWYSSLKALVKPLFIRVIILENSSLSGN